MQNLLQANHWMVGVDIHDYLPLPLPLPSPIPGFHLNGACLNWVVPAQKTTDVYGSGKNFFIHQGSDIANAIPHLCVIPLSPINFLSPIHAAMSGSKSHFGPASVKMNGKTPASAMMLAIGLNLNCQGPSACLPTAVPTGIVLGFNTIQTKLSLGDLFKGAISMILDSLFQTLFDKALGKCLDKFVNRQLEVVLKTGIGGGIKGFKAIAGTQVPGMILSILFGSPLSGSIGSELEKVTGESKFGWVSLYGKATGEVTNLIGDEAQKLGDAIEKKMEDIEKEFCKGVEHLVPSCPPPVA